MMKSLILLSILAVAMATIEQNGVLGKEDESRPRRCCLPPTLQMNVGGSEAYEVEGTSTHGLVKFVANYGMISKEGLVAVRTLDPKTYKAMQRLVMDYKNQVVYNITGDNCTKSTFKAPFPEMCIPESAEYKASFYLGGGWDTLHVNYWVYKNASLQMEEAMSFTRNCYPLSSDTSIVIGKVHAVIISGYSDIIDHISDPTLFNVPDSCKNKAATDMHNISKQPLSHKAVFMRI